MFQIHPAEAFAVAVGIGATADGIGTGLTAAIVLLWIRKLENKVPFEIQVFHTLKEAKVWMGITESKVAYLPPIHVPTSSSG